MTTIRVDLGVDLHEVGGGEFELQAELRQADAQLLLEGIVGGDHGRTAMQGAGRADAGPHRRDGLIRGAGRRRP